MAKSLEKKRQVKLQLAEKYLRLVKVAGSLPKRNTWQFHATRFLNQAEVIAQRQKNGEK